MASAWFVRQAGKVYGPFDASRMKKLAAAGKILRDSGVAKQHQGPWTQASRVKGLFPEEPQQDSEPDVVVDDAPSRNQPVRRGWLRRRLPVVELPQPPAGDTLWFYREIGKDDEHAKGPCTVEEIASLVDKGQVRASTLVLQQGDTHWETAFSAGLFLDDPIESDEERTCSEPRGRTSADDPTAKEEILWTGKPSHHANYGTYFLCFLTAPLVLPAIWGMKKYLARDCLRYQITSRRVRFKHSGDASTFSDILLADVRDAEFVSPGSLQATNLCNIHLHGRDNKKPLAILEGIPLAESALVISLCEAAVHRQIPTKAKERLLADARAQEQELLRRAEQRHKQEMAALRAQLETRQQLQQASRTTPEVPWRDFIPPPPATRRKQPVSGLTSWIFGVSKKRTIWVKGHYRGRKWIKRHKRQIEA